MQTVILPDLPTEEELKERDDMIRVLSSMNSIYQNSHYYISKEAERSIDQVKLCLMEEIQVEGGYFPKELWQSSKRPQKHEHARPGVRRAKTLNATTIDLSLTRIEELARREGQSSSAGAGAGYVFFFLWIP